MNTEEQAIWQQFKDEVQAALEKLYKAHMSELIKRGIAEKKKRILRREGMEDIKND